MSYQHNFRLSSIPSGSLTSSTMSRQGSVAPRIPSNVSSKSRRQGPTLCDSEDARSTIHITFEDFCNGLLDRLHRFKSAIATFAVADVWLRHGLSDVLDTFSNVRLGDACSAFIFYSKLLSLVLLLVCAVEIISSIWNHALAVDWRLRIAILFMPDGARIEFHEANCSNETTATLEATNTGKVEAREEAPDQERRRTYDEEITHNSKFVWPKSRISSSGTVVGPGDSSTG